MTAVNVARLADVCQQDRVTIRAGERPELRYVGLESLEAGTGLLSLGELSKTPDVPLANSFRFGPEHVLYGKLRPYLNKVAVVDFEGKCSTEIIPLLPDARLDRRYLAYFLRSSTTVSRISAKTAGARMPRADMSMVLDLAIPLPALGEQLCNVDVLSRAEGIVRLRREAQQKAAELNPAIFNQMFGDPALNLQRWPVMPLSEVTAIISGIAKGRRLALDESIELPYLRVANVKDGHLDLGEIKTIAIKHSEVEKLRIQPGDLLMTEGGDPDKLGRAALWNGEIELCVHQNHLFKVRCDRSRLNPVYLRSLVGSAYGKSYFLRVAKKTTGIASINKTQLSAFPVPVPPLQLQESFARRVQAVESIRSQQAAGMTTAQATFDALLNQIFSLG